MDQQRASSVAGARTGVHVVNLTGTLVVCLILVQLLLTVPGGHVVPYLFIAGVCVTIGLLPGKVNRVWSMCATLTMLVLIGCDHEAGRRYQENLFRAVSQHGEGEEAPHLRE